MATPQATPPATKPARMTLNALVRGKQDHPLRVVLFGVAGIGKSTFAASAPAPVFIGTEDGTANLDVTRFPAPESWQDIIDAIRTLERDEHEFKTLVIDTLDWAEPMLWAHICTRDSKKNLEAYGYGKGANAALDEWRIFVAALERLSKTKSMHVILVAHSFKKTFKNPAGDDFDRYEMKLQEKAAGLFKEWPDCLLFAQHETLTSKDERSRVRGVETGARLVHTEYRAAFDAKNRYGLPESMPLSWDEFYAAVRNATPPSHEALVSEIRRKARLVGGDAEKKTLEHLKKNPDPAKLAEINNRLSFRLAEKEAAQ